jgi:hypothetical protein
MCTRAAAQWPRRSRKNCFDSFAEALSVQTAHAGASGLISIPAPGKVLNDPGAAPRFNILWSQSFRLRQLRVWQLFCGKLQQMQTFPRLRDSIRPLRLLHKTI